MSHIKFCMLHQFLSRETFDDVVIYGASKHAVAGLIKGGAKGLAEYGINVNGYGPGVVRTEMWEQLDKELDYLDDFFGKSSEKKDKILLQKRQNMVLIEAKTFF